jgi:hypothetical protein
MRTNNTGQNETNVANFAALNASIVNEEEQLVKELLANETMQELEKNYLIDIAKHKNNSSIIKLLENIPTRLHN